MNNDQELNILKEKVDKLKDEKIIKQPFNNQLNPISIGIELVAGALAGLIIGVFLDKLFTTKPIFLIICLSFGIIASFKTILQKTKIRNNGS